jgi:hypothetical protein
MSPSAPLAKAAAAASSCGCFRRRMPGRRLHARLSIKQKAVFGAGATSWALGLDFNGTADPRIQRITSNILDRFVGKTN